MIIAYIPCPTLKDAKRISKTLLEKKLIACSNIYKSNSMFYWKDKLEDSEEYVIFAKTIDEKWDEVKNELEEIHPYDIPAIIKLPIESNNAYNEWILQQINR